MEITLEKFLQTLDQLEKGEVRVAEKIDGKWYVSMLKRDIVALELKEERVGTGVCRNSWPNTKSGSRTIPPR